MMNSGRSNRSEIIGPRIPGVSRGSCAVVDEMKMSISRHSLGQCWSATARPRTDAARRSARSNERLLTRISLTPRTRNARAEKEHFALRQIAENLDREIDHHRPNRHRAAGDLRPTTHLLRHTKGALKKTMQQWPGAPRFARERVRLLHLAEDFSLANDHGIQPAHYPEEMPHAFVPFVPIEPAGILSVLRASRSQTMRDLFCCDDLTRCGINFHAIARRQHQRLGATTLYAQRFQRLPRHVTLTRLHVGGVMADADAEKIHYIGRPCETNSIAHNTETSMLKTIPHSAVEKLVIHQACAL